MKVDIFIPCQNYFVWKG